jgi:phage shock protein C
VTKQLYLSNTNKVIAGLCGGLGEYFEVDPVLVRIIAVILFFATGFGLLAYIVGWIIVPRRAEGAEPTERKEYAAWHKYLPGLILIGIGAVLLAREYWYWYDLDDLWPILLIAAGLCLILIKGTVRRDDRLHSNETQFASGQSINGQDNGGTP